MFEEIEYLLCFRIVRVEEEDCTDLFEKGKHLLMNEGLIDLYEQKNKGENVEPVCVCMCVLKCVYMHLYIPGIFLEVIDFAHFSLSEASRLSDFKTITQFSLLSLFQNRYDFLKNKSISFSWKQRTGFLAHHYSVIDYILLLTSMIHRLVDFAVMKINRG